MVEPIVLIEHGPAETIDLTEEQYLALKDLDCVRLQRVSGGYKLIPGRKVGTVRLGDRQLTIRPKVVELNRVLFLMGYNSNPAIWKDGFVALDRADGLFPAVAESFVRLAARAIDRGIIRGYRDVRERSTVIRGRIDFRENIARNCGLPIPVAIEYRDFTADIPDNAVVLLATLRLLALPEIDPAVRERLSRLRSALETVTTVPRRGHRPRVTLTRTNTRYHDVLRLAEVILDNGSFEQRKGSLTVSGFMFDMWKVYEDFVTGALRTALLQFGGSAKVQQVHYLDVASKITLKPDLVWCDRTGAPVAVIDAKYKAEKRHGFPQDLYQVLAYCSVLGLTEGHLVYAKGNEPAVSHEVRTCGITIHCHALDLALSPNDLLDSIQSIARTAMHR